MQWSKNEYWLECIHCSHCYRRKCPTETIWGREGRIYSCLFWRILSTVVERRPGGSMQALCQQGHETPCSHSKGSGNRGREEEGEEGKKQKRRRGWRREGRRRNRQTESERVWVWPEAFLPHNIALWLPSCRLAPPPKESTVYSLLFLWLWQHPGPEATWRGKGLLDSVLGGDKFKAACSYLWAPGSN